MDWAQIQTMLYLQLLLISLNLVLVLADHKEDEPQETNYDGSPTWGGLPIVAQPIQGTGTSDGHSTSRAERQSDLARIGPANTTNSSLRRTGRYTQITTSIGGSTIYWHKQWGPNSTSSQK